jgi:plastocyanin
MKTSLTALIVCGLALMVVGCSSGNSAYSGPEPAAVVVMHSHTFEPERVAIKAGETVRWNNTSLIWHTATFDPAMAKEPSHVALPAGAQPFDSGKVESGSNWWHTFTVPGTYHYICKPHESKGMAGTVVVLEK